MVGTGGAPRASMRHTIPAPGRLRVEFGGELDLASLAAFDSELTRVLSTQATDVVIDLAAVRFLDSSAIAILVRIANHFPAVSVIGASPIVRRTIDALGLGAHLGLGPSEDQAERK